MEIYSIFESFTETVSNYGWYILVFIIISLYIYNNYLAAPLREYLKRREEYEYSAKYHKNPDLLEKRLLAQQSYVEKLQEKYNEEAERYKKQMEEKELKKREELLDKLEGKGGTKLGNSFKPEYNPLMGAGNSSGYRAPKKSCCKKGGGCG